MTQYSNNNIPPLDLKKYTPAIILFGVIFVLIMFGSSMTVTIKSGQAGVLYAKFNGGVELEKPYDEGFHFIAPWNTMFIYNMRQQSISEKMPVLSVNGLAVKVDGTVWFELLASKLPYLHKTKGPEYIAKILKPAISSASRKVVGRYTPEQLYSSKRDIIQNEIFEETQNELENQFITINRVLVEDVQLPPTIKEAIERKLKQEQESLEYEFRLEKAKKEAEKQKIEAEGKAKANKILSASLTDKILKEKGIEATLKLAESPNSKVVIVGGKDGLPLILGNN